MIAAPPLTRGSTAILRKDTGAAIGSPAHAGIDPYEKWLRSGLTGLPRSRGDRLRPAMAEALEPAELAIGAGSA